jgi:hypothetical protein
MVPLINGAGVTLKYSVRLNSTISLPPPRPRRGRQ